MRQNEGNASRTRSPRGKSPSGKTSRLPCNDDLKGTCTNSFCEKWHLPECLCYQSENRCRFRESALVCTVRLKNSPAKSEKNGDKSVVVTLQKNEHHQRMGIIKNTTIGCVFQGRRSFHLILRKSSDIRKPIRCVKSTKAIVRLCCVCFVCFVCAVCAVCV